MEKENNHKECCSGLGRGNSHSFDDHNGVFSPVCCPGVCRVPRGRNIVEIVKGQGIISSEEVEPEEPVDPEEVEPGPMEEDEKEAEFTFSIYKEHGKIYGEICIVDYEGKIKLQSKQLECFHSDYASKLVAIFHLEGNEGEGSRELTVYARPRVCTLPGKFYAYSAPLCGEEILIGGDILKGDIEFLKEGKEDTH